MDAYSHNQATMPHFSGQYRQRGSGFGALAMGIGQVALPLARKFIVPAAKRIGKEFLVQAAPELIVIDTRKKTPRQALKNTVKNTIKKQDGAGRSKSRMSGKRKTTTKRKRKILITKKRTPLRSRFNFFTKVRKMIFNLLPTEATHSSLDLFEKPPLQITFENTLTQKIGPSFPEF